MTPVREVASPRPYHFRMRPDSKIPFDEEVALRQAVAEAGDDPEAQRALALQVAIIDAGRMAGSGARAAGICIALAIVVVAAVPFIKL